MLLLNQAQEYNQLDLTIYKQLIEKLMYLAHKTKLDIAFILSQLNLHNSNSQMGNLCIAKQVLGYLKEIITLGIKWGNNPVSYCQHKKYGPLTVVEYANNSYTDHFEDKKSISGYCFYLKRAIMTWPSKRQQTISISTSKTKYVAMNHKVKKAI